MSEEAYNGRILHVDWGDVEAYVNPSTGELAIRSREIGDWHIRAINIEAYLSKLREVDPVTEVIEMKQSPWCKDE